MALSEKHRSALYEHFAPTLGEEVTEAFLDQFPRGTADEPVTREYLDLVLDARFAQVDARIGNVLGQLTAVILGAATVVVATIGVATTVIITALP